MDYISFDELRRSAESRWPEPIETSLLGDVPWKHDRASGKMTGVIPEWITIGAAKHGLEVLVADFRRGTYSFRLCEPHNASFSREPERSVGESAGSDSYGGNDD